MENGTGLKPLLAGGLSGMRKRPFQQNEGDMFSAVFGLFLAATSMAHATDTEQAFALEELIPLARAAIVDASFYDAHELTDFQLVANPPKDCAVVVTARTISKKYSKSFNVCMVQVSEARDLKAEVFFDYGCKVVCGYPHRNVVEHYFSVSGYHQESPEKAFAKAEQRCLKETESTGRLLKMADHGGPDNQRTLATVDNSCFAD